ncbi:MAG: hypothetical protein J7494_02930 [Sphingobium sp.]|nr:hypothetical protein [Sphingobium sp.]
MTGGEPLSDAALDRLLGRLPAPEIPADLALRIVANAAALPQHKPREAVVAAVTPAPLPLARQAAASRMAGLLTFAAAACLALVLIPLAGQQPADNATATRSIAARPSPSGPIAQPAAQVAEAPRPVASHPIRARRASAQPRVVEQAMPEPWSPAVQPVPQEVAQAETPPASPAAAPDLPRVVQAAGPKVSVHGPPAPIDIILANSRPAQGLGVVGGAGMGAMPGQR